MLLTLNAKTNMTYVTTVVIDDDFNYGLIQSVKRLLKICMSYHYNYNIIYTFSITISQTSIARTVDEYLCFWFRDKTKEIVIQQIPK